MLTVADVGIEALSALAAAYSARVVETPAGVPIPGSFWGEPEAGLVAGTVHVRADTPVHSFLHEFSHFICMDEARRSGLDTDAGGDDLEEAAVCYLQILLAEEIPGVGRERLMRDMDAWGYSFRLGSTRAWFEGDAADAEAWLRRHALIDAERRPLAGRLRCSRED